MNALMVVNSEKTKKKAALEYCVKYLIFVFCFYPCFSYLLFKRVQPLSVEKSRLVLLLVMAVAMGLGRILDTRFPGRNRSSALAAALSGYAVYTMLSYWNILSFRIDFLTEIACILLIAVVEKRKTGKVHVISELLAFSATVLVVCAWFAGCFNTAFMTSSTEYRQEPEVSITETQKQEMKTGILNLDSLTLQEKVDVLQLVVNCECGSLGIVEIPVVGVGTLTEGCVGEFIRNTDEIVIDEHYLTYGKPEEILTTALHEARHSYQYELVSLYRSLPEKYKSLYIFNDSFGELNISELATELATYTSDPEKGYYQQMCEDDARKYGENAAEFYMAWAKAD